MTPKQLLHEWMDQVWNRKDTDFIHRHMANPCAIAGLPESAGNPEGFTAFRDGLINAIPDMHVEVENAVENGEEVAGTCRVTGTHKSSGAPVDFHFGFASVIRDNKIVSARNVVDFLTMLQQIKAIDPDALENSLM